jgi:hypothetical protein
MSLILGILAQVESAPPAPTFDSDYESITTVSVGSGGNASITFSSIPSTFKHLQIRGISRSNNATVANNSIGIRLNSDTGSNYNSHFISGTGDGGTLSAFTFGTDTYMYLPTGGGNGATASVFGAFIIDILDYTNTSKNTVVRSLSGVDSNGSGNLRFASGLWMNTNAVTTILIDGRGDTFLQYSSFALYGTKG